MVNDSRPDRLTKRGCLAAVTQFLSGSTRALACPDRRPRRSDEASLQPPTGEDKDALPLFREGAEQSTRGACAPHLHLHGCGLARASHGFVMMELIVAIGILGAVMLPLAFSFFHEQKLCRAYYFRAVAMELIDGEMEALAAGEWQSFPEGKQTYAMRGEAAKNLPAGQFTLTVEATILRLEWRPDKPGQGGTVSREVKLDFVRRTK